MQNLAFGQAMLAAAKDYKKVMEVGCLGVMETRELRCPVTAGVLHQGK